jgi:dTDP-4-dehydrorhamnose reductase
MREGGARRVLVLGGTGMLGHKIVQMLRERVATWVAVRSPDRPYYEGLFDSDRLLTGVDAANFDSVIRACAGARPHVVVNCVGVVKQRREAADPLPALAVNALFPHRLAGLTRALGARLLHVSTDCVFAGTRGGYTEDDIPDATDLYGRSKLLGEVTGPGCLTLRTSIIGRELSSAAGLLEWFLSHRGGRVRGYTRARFSGLTTLALARVTADLIEHHPALEGLYHVASEPIDKYDLLRRIDAAVGAGVAIEPDETICIDRSLDGTRFAAAFGRAVPGWDAMIAELAADPTPYDDWRGQRV